MNRFNVTNYNVQIHTEVNNPVAYNASPFNMCPDLATLSSC